MEEKPVKIYDSVDRKIDTKLEEQYEKVQENA